MGNSHYFYGSTNTKKIELTDLTLNKDDIGYYLTAKFKVEDEHSIREAKFPKIRLNINESRLSVKTETSDYDLRDYAWADIGFGMLPLDYEIVDGLKVAYTEKILEEKYTEMTLDEIEKKLGHKIKIVNK